MISNLYHDQVRLLIEILPEFGKESCFAMHGGTAINFFVRNMPRLSVDIDLTYLPIEDRAVTLSGILSGLSRIKNRIKSKIPHIQIRGPEDTPQQSKLFLRMPGGVQVKAEVNTTMRGVLGQPMVLPVCEKVVREYSSFCEMRIVPIGQLYAGKMCAALNRQHPRDIFDIKYMLEQGGITEDIKRGFILMMLGGDKPIHETLHPNLLEQQSLLSLQFEGMTEEHFDYEEFKKVRTEYFSLVPACFNDNEKEFILNFVSGAPNWRKYGFDELSIYPSLQWKLLNLNKLKRENPTKFDEQLTGLEKIFN